MDADCIVAEWLKEWLNITSLLNRSLACCYILWARLMCSFSAAGKCVRGALPACLFDRERALASPCTGRPCSSGDGGSGPAIGAPCTCVQLHICLAAGLSAAGSQPRWQSTTCLSASCLSAGPDSQASHDTPHVLQCSKSILGPTRKKGARPTHHLLAATNKHQKHQIKQTGRCISMHRALHAATQRKLHCWHGRPYQNRKGVVFSS